MRKIILFGAIRTTLHLWKIFKFVKTRHIRSFFYAIQDPMQLKLLIPLLVNHCTRDAVSIVEQQYVSVEILMVLLILNVILY